MKYIKTAGFESFVDQHLKLQNKNSLDEEEGMPQKEIEAQIQKIKTSASLAELSQNVDEMAQILNLEKFPNPAKVIAYQARAKVQVLDKLNDFLLSSEKGLPASDFTEENRSLVSHIMKTSWVTSPDEVDFYMNEFDARFNKAG